MWYDLNNEQPNKYRRFGVSEYRNWPIQWSIQVTVWSATHFNWYSKVHWFHRKQNTGAFDIPGKIHHKPLCNSFLHTTKSAQTYYTDTHIDSIECICLPIYRLPFSTFMFILLSQREVRFENQKCHKISNQDIFVNIYIESRALQWQHSMESMDVSLFRKKFLIPIENGFCHWLILSLNFKIWQQMQFGGEHKHVHVMAPACAAFRYQK